MIPSYWMNFGFILFFKKKKKRRKTETTPVPVVDWPSKHQEVFIHSSHKITDRSRFFVGGVNRACLLPTP